MSEEAKISFSFGENWKNFIDKADQSSIDSAKKDLIDWLGQEKIKDKRIIDIGCGSGIHSLCFFLLGAKEATSFDYDPRSVEATKFLWDKFGSPSNWKIFQGSILDKELPNPLIGAKFDIVYAWGSLHHTGKMWEAVENASELVAENGYFWISLYKKGPNYQKDLNLKIIYNKSNKLFKKMIVAAYILRIMFRRLIHLQNPFLWNQRRSRGMSTYYDIVDWFGGLPYEVASEEEIVEFCKKKSLFLKKKKIANEGHCSIYLFSKS